MLARRRNCCRLNKKADKEKRSHPQAKSEGPEEAQRERERRRASRTFVRTSTQADNEGKLFRFFPRGEEPIRFSPTLSYSLQKRFVYMRSYRYICVYIKFPPCGRMNNDLPVIQIVAIHLQPIGDSVLVPIKRTQVRVSGWTVVLRRHPPVGDRRVFRRAIDTTIFRSHIISHGSPRATAKKRIGLCAAAQRA